MKYLHSAWCRWLARVLVLALAVGAIPATCLAGDPPQSGQPTTTLSASIQKAVALETGKVGRVPARSEFQGSGGSATDLTSKSFFKSKAGIATLVAIAAGVGFALYSTSHDRVKSPNQPYGGTK